MKKKIVVILIASFLLTACGKKEKESLATIQDLYGDEPTVTQTDEVGNTIIVSDTSSRKLTDVHPELSSYNPNVSYGNYYYLPTYDMCIGKDRFELIYNDGACMVIKDTENPTAGYTLLSIAEYKAYPSDEEAAKAIMPYAKIYRAADDSIQDVLLFDAPSLKQDQISGRSGTGMKMDLICSDAYVPSYAYGVYERNKNTSNGVFMVTDNIVTENNGARKAGEPKEQILIDTRTNTDADTMMSHLIEKPQVNYAIYSDLTSIAVPTFMQIEKENDGIVVSDKEGEISSLTRCGMILLYNSSSFSINDYVEILKSNVAKKYECEDSMSKIATTDIKYEDNIDFLGKSDAKHIYGTLTAKDRTKSITTTMPGNGYFKFDVFVVNKGGTQYTAMYYYGEAQEEEMKNWISLNCY